MKNLILSVICILVSAITFAGGPKKGQEDNKFELQGYYLKKSNVSYEVFKVTNDSWELVEEGKSIRYYNIELDINCTYVIVFKKDSINKLLYVDVQKPTTIDVDIDFKYKQDAALKYTKDMNKYKVNIINIE